MQTPVRSSSGVESQVLLAPAKLNLSLQVLGRRPDGYHEIETLMTPVSLADRLTVRMGVGRGVRLSLRAGGGLPVGEIPSDHRNLVVRAIEALATAAGIEPSVEVDLEKWIPAGAGLGGGSSDAAAAIRAVARLWGLDWPVARLAGIGAAIGSDIPWFFAAGPAIACGRGERVEPVAPLPALAAVVVWPGVPLATAAVYRAWTEEGAAGGRPGASLALAAALSAGRWQEVWPLLTNDLEAPARRLCDRIDASLDALARAGGVQPRLTGSGSACFALCRTLAEARGIAARFSACLPADSERGFSLVRAVRLPAMGGG